MFWTDRWLHGHCIADLAPLLLLAIPHRPRRQQKYKMPSKIMLGFQIFRGPSQLLLLSIELWDLLEDVQLQQERMILIYLEVGCKLPVLS
jgi:hypothetical protein